MILFDNKIKIKWKHDNLIKIKKKNLKLNYKKSNVEGWIEKKNNFKRDQITWLESACRIHGPIVRLG